jgi:hypothetical protein
MAIALQTGEHPGYVSGRYYPVMGGPVGTTTALGAADTLYLYPFRVRRRVSVSAISVRVVTAGAGSSAKAAIYANNLNTGRPVGAPVLVDDTGLTTQANSETRDFAMAGTLEPGWYWFACKATGTMPVFQALTASDYMTTTNAGRASPSSALTAITMASTYADALPALADGQAYSDFATTGPPLAFFKVA